MRNARKKSFRNRRVRRRRRRGLLLLGVLLIAAVASWKTIADLGKPDSSAENSMPGQRVAWVEKQPTARPLGAPDPPNLTLAGFAYRSVDSELPEAQPADVGRVHQSVLDPAWASVRIKARGRDGDHYYAVFMRKNGDKWTAKRSVLIENQAHPKDVKTLLTGIPEDLVNPLFPQDDLTVPAAKPPDRAVQVIAQATGGEDSWEAGSPESVGELHRVPVENKENSDQSTDVYLRGDALEVVAIGRELTSAEVPGFPAKLVEQVRVPTPDPVQVGSTEPVYEGAVERKRVDRGLERALQEVEGYSGIAGFYVRDLKSGAGYGVRPDEVFFSASTIKIPVMIAVYRRIDNGDLDYETSIVTQDEDWAAGAGWLRWETPGARTTVEDALWLMMTQSDNVATNALMRRVGGPEYVNKVARDLGAENTRLVWRVSSERAAVPSLDNHTTPYDMATMLQKIYSGKAASDFACEEMIDLLKQNKLEWWIEAGVPPEVEVANKGGWLDSTYNDVGIVEHEDRPYVLTIFTQYGRRMQQGQETIEGISRGIWLAQTGKTVDESVKERQEKPPEQRRKTPERNSREQAG